MVTLKSAREIEAMRRSGKITSRVLTDLMKAARAGMTTQELDELAERGIRAAGGVPTFKGYNGFPASICASVNDEVVHGIPGTRMLHDGDLLSIDIGTTLDGYVSDSAVTIPRGNHLGDIGAAIQTHAEGHGYGVVRELVGHGVGRAMHEEPQVPNYGKAGSGLELRPGLVLALEPMITQADPAIRILGDGWTVVTADGKLAAHFEDTIAVTDDGPKILTLRDYGEDPAIERYRPTREAIA
jgi:methionyl aminopeptidase